MEHFLLKRGGIQNLKMGNYKLIIKMVRKGPPVNTYNLGENFRGGLGLRIEEVQNVARVLDPILSRLLWGVEAVVPTAVEILEAVGAII